MQKSSIKALMRGTRSEDCASARINRARNKDTRGSYSGRLVKSIFFCAPRVRMLINESFMPCTHQLKAPRVHMEILLYNMMKEAL